MSGVLNWVRSNVYAVIFVAIMVTVPIALWVVSGRMNAAVREDVEARASKMAELSRLEKTSVSLDIPGPDNPSVTASIPVNRRFLERYQEVVDRIAEDAAQIRAEVVEINRKGRGVLLEELFPEPPMHLRETLPGQMYRTLRGAYQGLLQDVRAGSPPSAENMLQDLQSARERYMTQILKRSTADLTEEEQTWLTEQLTKTRLSIYAETAKSISLYATLAALGMPDESERPNSAEGEANSLMFEWQWQYWIKQDILMALSEANRPYVSVVDAPVKRLVSLAVIDSPGQDFSAASGSTAGSGSAGPTAGFGTGAAGRRRGAASSGSAARPGVAADPSREIPLDYSVSFTGRKTNPVYDVRRVELVIDVDGARIPEVFDALARQNFITVLDARVETLDLFAAIRDGYFYGSAPVSTLTLDLETIWLREWTAQFMPPTLKQTLGIAIEAKSTG
jgi:hypothetical protein